MTNERADTSNRPTEAGRETEGDDCPTLRYEVVESSTGPDRCTVYESGTSGVELMSTWISLDASSLVDLDGAR